MLDVVNGHDVVFNDYACDWLDDCDAAAAGDTPTRFDPYASNAVVDFWLDARWAP